MAVSITLRSVSKRFGATAAVDRVSLDIDPGELFFLLGPSGCGKTTLLRTLAGFYTPDEGTLHIGDQDITRLPPHRRHTGMVFQSYALWPHLSVFDNVAFGLEMRKLGRDEIRERVTTALATVRMSERADSKPNQLSGGQQQRVALARALVVHPQCLLLDEPLSNLDAKLRLEMRTEIRRICKEAGLTAIYVTHDQKEALSIADRLAVLDNGRIQQIGRPMDVYRQPESVFVAQFIGETNFLSGRVRERREKGLTVETDIGVLQSEGETPFQTGDAVRVSIRPEAVQIADEAAGGVNTFEGAIHDTLYLGEVAQHQFRVHENQQLKVFELNPRRVARDTDQRAHARIAPGDVTVLAEPTPGT